MPSQAEKVHTPSTLAGDAPGDAIPTAIGIVAIEATGGVLPDHYHKTRSFIGTVTGSTPNPQMINARFTNFLHLRH
jgi:hypothetical protein